MINPAFSSGLASVLQRYVGMKRASAKFIVKNQLEVLGSLKRTLQTQRLSISEEPRPIECATVHLFNPEGPECATPRHANPLLASYVLNRKQKYFNISGSLK